MQNGKIIKKILQVTAALLFLIFAIPATAYVLLQSQRIQNALLHQVTRFVSEKLNSRFSVGRVDIAFLYRIRFHDVYLQDLSGDTLLYARTVTAGIRRFNPLRHDLTFGSINLDRSDLALKIDSTGNLNLAYFIQLLKGNGKGEGKWKVHFNNLRMTDGRFSLSNANAPQVPYGVNYSDMYVYHINAEVSKFNPSPDSLTFQIKKLQFVERSGFRLNNLSARFSEGKDHLSFSGLAIKTPYSNLQGKVISMHFSDWDKFKPATFFQHVFFRISLAGSQVDLYDIGFFAPAFRETHQLARITGSVTGTIGNLKGKGLEIGFGKDSRIIGELNLEGLPDFHSTFIYANIHEFKSGSDDLRNLLLPGNRTIKVPSQLNKLGQITYRGQFTGFINDFVAFGNFNTGLGNLHTDLLFRPDTARYVDFEGKLNATDFDLGTLLEASANMGKISLSVSVNGRTSEGKSIQADLNGLISHFEFKKYEYSNIALEGNLRNKTYNGSIRIHDPNIACEFLGRVNLSDTIAAFDFTAHVSKANLYALNIESEDSAFIASFDVTAKGTGNSINTLNGEIQLQNSIFLKKDKQLQIDNFTIKAEDTTGFNHLQLRSDFLDADLRGSYQLSSVKSTFEQFLQGYLPALTDSNRIQLLDKDTKFILQADVKDTKPLFSFFFPHYFLAENSKLHGEYSSKSRILDVNLQSPSIYFNGITWNGLVLNIAGNRDSLNLQAGGKNLSIGKSIRLDNFTMISNTANDSSDIAVRWNNWEDNQNRGDLRALASFSRMPANRHPHIAVDLFKTMVIASDSVWNVSPGKITIDSTRLEISNLKVMHRDQYFTLGGILSEQPDNKIDLVFNHFNLSDLNGITGANGFNLGGELDGYASVSNIYHNPLFTSQMSIDSLLVNSEMLGNSTITASWDDRNKVINIDAHTMRDNLKTIDIHGKYAPAGAGILDFDLVLDKLRLNIFNPYVKTIFTDLRGIGSGKARLTGSLARPLINGEINLQKSAFTVNYLKTRYNFSQKVEIENNNFYFNNIRIYDPKGNSAYLNGVIRSQYLKNFQLDINLHSKDFMCLNTNKTDNNLFYGTAFATGDIRIAGPPKNLTMDITATTSNNTSIKIPLSNEGRLTEYNFITILHKDSDNTPVEVAETNYQVDLSGMQINFDLTVTPNAEVQIIFDPKLGDIIRGRGNGNLNMKINTNGNFLMYGEYKIDEGDYLFTAQNFINKKFTINPGGWIRWNGDPFDANIDIVAYYQTRASLSDLYGTTDEKAKTKMVVDDRLTISGKLMKPDVKYDIYLPNADEETRVNLSNAINSSDELNKQFIALLMMNRFVLRSGATQAASSSNTSPYSNAAGVNASEFLSNQLSNWLSQISNDVDVGINYRPNRELNAETNRAMKSDEVQLALSTQLFNDRLTLNGSVDVATNAAVNASDNIVGEFDLEYKLTKNGKFRIKTYNHVNNDILYQNTQYYTQGLGLIYKEEFNSVGELWKNYLNSLKGKKEEENKVPKSENSGDAVNK